MNESTPDKRRRYRRHWNSLSRLRAFYEENDVDFRLRKYPEFPEDLIGLTCGAKSKRTGQPCKSKALYYSGRCKFHGGCSTGPKTKAGKRKAAMNGKKGGRPKKPKAMGG